MDFAKVCLLVVGLLNTVYVLTAVSPPVIGIGNACNSTVTCVANAVCSKTTNNTCVCSPAFKVDSSKCAPKGLGDSCTNKTHCISVNHSTCDTKTSHKCICSPTYKAVGGQCKIKVIGATCSAGNSTAVCSLDNSKCDSSTNKCACKAGYYNQNDQCLKALGSTCGSGNGSTVCTSQNSACNTTKNQCACTAGFVAEDVACPIAVGQTCKATTECVSNADCGSSKKCTCKGGFQKADGLCERSSAGEHKIAFSIAGISLLLAILNMF